LGKLGFKEASDKPQVNKIKEKENASDEGEETKQWKLRHINRWIPIQSKNEIGNERKRERERERNETFGDLQWRCDGEVVASVGGGALFSHG